MVRARVLQDRRRRDRRGHRSLHAGGAGLDFVDEPADVVVMSSATDRFRSCARMVPGDPEVLNALEIARGGPIEVGGVAFEALPTMESLEHKENPEENAVYRFELGG